LTLGAIVKALAVVALCSVGCSRGVGSELRVPDGTPIVLISVDTLRSDRLPAYGYGGVETTAALKRRRSINCAGTGSFSNVPTPTCR